MTKSYVSLEQNVCPVCARTFDTNAILIHERLSETLEKHTITGWSLCPEHEKLHEEGYVALVSIDPNRSRPPHKPDTVFRTGKIMHIRRSAWPNIFGEAAPETPMTFCGDDLVEKLQAMMGQSGE
jgi:hypothetical protein